MIEDGWIEAGLCTTSYKHRAQLLVVDTALSLTRSDRRAQQGLLLIDAVFVCCNVVRSSTSTVPCALVLVAVFCLSLLARF